MRGSALVIISFLPCFSFLCFPFVFSTSPSGRSFCTVSPHFTPKCVVERFPLSFLAVSPFAVYLPVLPYILSFPRPWSYAFYPRAGVSLGCWFRLHSLAAIWSYYVLSLVIVGLGGFSFLPRGTTLWGSQRVFSSVAYRGACLLKARGRYSAGFRPYFFAFGVIGLTSGRRAS